MEAPQSGSVSLAFAQAEAHGETDRDERQCGQDEGGNGRFEGGIDAGLVAGEGGWPLPRVPICPQSLKKEEPFVCVVSESIHFPPGSGISNS